MEEPLAEQSPIEQGLVHEPPTPGPIVDQPHRDEPPAPGPIVDQPPTPGPIGDQPPAPGPIVDELDRDEPLEPIVDELDRDEPLEPIVDELDRDEPSAWEPVAAEPYQDQVRTWEPHTEEPAGQEPAIDHPYTEEPAGQEPAIDHPYTEEPGTDLSMVDEPGIGHPIADEPSAEPPVDFDSFDPPTVDDLGTGHPVEADALWPVATMPDEGEGALGDDGLDDPEVGGDGESQPLSSTERLAARATTPELGQLELRQIAGLTSGITMELEPDRYDFSQSEEGVGFQIEVDQNDRAVVYPGSAEAKLDTIPVTAPAVIGAGVLDVGSARFLVRHRRERKRATDWLDQHDSIDRREPLIEVPGDLGVETDEAAPAPSPKRRRGRRHKRRSHDGETSLQALDVASWEFVERVRATRIEVTDRERYLHPDPAELAERARHRAPILGIRPPGHPLFAKVGVLVADMPWMPRFDDISAIPDSLGPHLKPLMSLPSLPIAADLMIGPLGIVGNRTATVACARHILVSLFGLSTPGLHLHIATDDERLDVWDWAFDLAPPRPIEIDAGFPVVIVDGMENYAATGLDHTHAIDHQVGAVILADGVGDLPSYCGTVLQVDAAGSGLLTNHLGHIIAGTPVGITTAFASAVADDLHAVMKRRHAR